MQKSPKKVTSPETMTVFFIIIFLYTSSTTNTVMLYISSYIFTNAKRLNGPKLYIFNAKYISIVVILVLNVTLKLCSINPSS